MKATISNSKLPNASQFQYPKVRLKDRLFAAFWVAQSQFQYPKVRLKAPECDICTCTDEVSIPEGAIEGPTGRNAQIISRRVSIPEGAIEG